MQKHDSRPAIAIDMGERNHLALVSDCPDFRPILVPNQLGKKQLLRLGRMARRSPETFRSEMRELSRYMEERCHEVVQTCLKWDIHFVAIGDRSIRNPYRIKNRSLRENPLLNLTIQIIHTLRFQCALSRIDTFLVDEAFTSQVDALQLENIEYAGNKKFRKRSNRGHLRGKVYWSEAGETLDRDINAAINIGRIAFGNRFAEAVLNYGTWKDPIHLNWGAGAPNSRFTGNLEMGQAASFTPEWPAPTPLDRPMEEYLDMAEDFPHGFVSQMVH